MCRGTTGMQLVIEKLTEDGKHTTYTRIHIKIDVDCEYPEAIPVADRI